MNPDRPLPLNRREFLGRTVATGTSAAFVPACSTLIPASALGRDGHTAPSERVNMGVVGTGDHCVKWNLPRMFANADQQVRALCDVDSKRLAAAEQQVNSHYRESLQMDYRCQSFGDFRDLINQRDLDAIAVVTPDHWHVIPAMMALKTGKHVICEKPLSLTIAEGKVLTQLAKQTGLVFQTASENRSVEPYIRMVELVRAGVFGKIKHMKILTPPSNRHRRTIGETAETPPDSLNYEIWQGQAPEMPYHASRVHFDFRWHLAYSGGIITDWGAHMVDLAHWAMRKERTGPVEISGTGKFPPRDAIWNTATEFDCRLRYADGLTADFFSDAPGLKFEGTDGWVLSRGWRSPARSNRPELLDVELDPRDRLPRPRTDGRGGEHMDFTDAIKAGREAYAPAEIGHRTISVAHLCNIAMMTGRTIRWDPDREEIRDDREASEMLGRDQRDPWTIERIDQWINVG